MTPKMRQIQEPLYQECPLYDSRNPSLVPCSFTESMPSYMKAARRESWILEHCGRRPNHEIVLRYFVEWDIKMIRQHWQRIRANMKRAKITFAATVEFTDGKNGRPSNCLHYHFLIDSTMSREELKETMKTICLSSSIGTYRQDFDLIFPNAGIKDWGTRKIHYFTKYKLTGKVYLFKTGLRLKKFYYSSDWFLEAEGTVTTRAKILQHLKSEYQKRKMSANQME